MKTKKEKETQKRKEKWEEKARHTAKLCECVDVNKSSPPAVLSRLNIPRIIPLQSLLHDGEVRGR